MARGKVPGKDSVRGFWRSAPIFNFGIRWYNRSQNLRQLPEFYR